jgi:hypothetical protein
MDELFEITIEALGDLREKILKKGRKLAQRFGFIKKDETDEEKAAKAKKERKRPRPSVMGRQEVIEEEEEIPPLNEEQLEELAQFKAMVQQKPPPKPRSPKIANDRYKWNLELSRPPDDVFVQKDKNVVNDKRSVPAMVMITGGANVAEVFFPPHHPKQHLGGEYRQSPSWMANGDVVWEHVQGDRFLYLSQADKWTITEDPYAVGGKRGQLHSCERARGKLPHEMTRWQYNGESDWKEDEDIHVLSKYSLPQSAYGVFGIYHRMKDDLNMHPVYVKVVGKKGDMLHETKLGIADRNSMDALPGMVQDDADSEMDMLENAVGGGRRPKIPDVFKESIEQSIEESKHYFSPGKSKGEDSANSEIVMKPLAEMPDEYAKYLYFVDVGYWVCSGKVGSTSGFMRCDVPAGGASRGPEMLGGEDHPWYVWNPNKSDYEPCPGVLCNRLGKYEEFHSQAMTRTRLKKVEECDRLTEMYWQREKLKAKMKFDAEAEAAKAPYSNVGTKAVYDMEMGLPAGGEKKKQKVPAHVQAMLDAAATKNRTKEDDAGFTKCFHCWRPATSKLYVRGGCPKCLAPRCIHCAQVDAKWVKNPQYDKIMAERKKKKKEEEAGGPRGREMTYKEKKEAEKKAAAQAKQAASENDAKTVPSKCKHCNAEIFEFGRWDKDDSGATPAFAK